MCRMDLIAWGLTTLVAAFVGSFLAGYLKKKAEDLATHEDINKLVDQVAAVTTTTKEIEGKISNEFWGQRKKWEIRKEALFEVVKEIGTLQNVIGSTAGAYRVIEGVTDKDQEFMARTRASEAFAKFEDAHTTFTRAVSVAIVVSGQDVRNSLNSVNAAILGIIGAAMHGDNNSVSTLMPQFAAEVYKLHAAIRKELDIE